MSWIVANWKLKLLAVALTLGLLAAVAFSENPIAFNTIPATVDYVPPAGDVVLVDPVTTVGVQVTGLADTVRALKPENVEVRADASKLKAGADTTVSAQVRVLVPNVSATTGTVPIRVVTDRLSEKTLDIEVRTPNTASGWKIDQDPKRTHAQCQPDPGAPCQVKVSGPSRLIDRLKAYVSIQQPINNNLLSFPSQPVRFERDGQPVDLTKIRALPPIRVDPATVTVQVTASSTSAQRMVAVNVPMSGRPACGFAVTGLTISPGNGVVTISGPADVVTAHDSVTTDGIDITGATSSVSKSLTIRAPDQVTAQPATVQVTVGIQRQFECTAPTPTPTPSVPTPTPTPTTH